MICAQRLLRRARAMNEEEMMEIHLENQMGKKKQKNLPLIQALQWIITVEGWSVEFFFKVDNSCSYICL